MLHWRVKACVPNTYFSFFLMGSPYKKLIKIEQVFYIIYQLFYIGRPPPGTKFRAPASEK